MAERQSWREIDRRRDNPGGRRKRKNGERELPQHSTRYERYKADLDRLFDQGLAGELLRKAGKHPAAQAREAAAEEASQAAPEQQEPATRAKKAARRPRVNRRAAGKLKLMRAVIDAPAGEGVCQAIDELVERFGLPDDWEVLVRTLEHDDEALVLQAVDKMSVVLPGLAKVPRRLSVKERLRTISQTASEADLRARAEKLQQLL
ncbi:MAG: hypothetical protein DRI34_03805 [Deltaproteobacteria bacterium]|nr:MAG: hypothetical protein DRI34_03805 [Deltaproteobacteria bacterium]